MSYANRLKIGLIIVFTTFTGHGLAANLPQVTGLSIEGNVLSWDSQDVADGYNVYLNYSYYDTVRGSQSYVLSERGTYHVVSFNNAGDFGVIRNANDSVEFAVRYGGICSNNAVEIAPLNLPYVREDSLGVDIVEDRVDFFRFEAEPETILIANLRGSNSGSGDLDDPLLGLFDSDCEEIAVDDDSSGTESSLRFAVPEDGIFFLAATRYSDYQFNGMNQTTGGSTYTLSVDVVPENIGSITARLVNSLNGTPLDGEQSPFAFAELYRCELECNEFIDYQSADSAGLVFFTSENIVDFPSGTFVLRAQANDFGFSESERFTVGTGEDFDFGDVSLTPPSVQLANIVACDDIPPQGGICNYEFQVYNNTDDTLSALVWSNVESSGLSSPLGYTTFEANSANPSEGVVTRYAMEVPAFASSTAMFSFEVPSSVPEGAQFCQSAWIGIIPDPLFNTLDQQFLFCVVRDLSGFERVVGTAMAKASARYKEKAISDQRRSLGIPPVD
ncbi:MAG: hypothetical protein AB8B63_24795 [Granulosicoccus sp.]